MRRTPGFAPRRVHAALLTLAACACACAGLVLARPGALAEGSLSLRVSAAPTSVVRGGAVTYTARVENRATVASDVLRLAVTLPAGFRYVSGSTRLSLNGALVATPNPTASGATLTWASLRLPVARTAGNWGMHTFVQDRCDNGYIGYQLDRVRELMGPQAFVTQLFYRIGVETSGPEACWVAFVNACYDRDLIPVVRLQGSYGGPNWLKPPADAPGDYRSIAQAYARVVSGLPRRDNRPLYVEVWNEPNLDIEWDGAANPVEYAHFLVDVAAALRGLGDARIRVLNGALSPGGNYAPLGFISAMATVPGALQAFDVWAAHPYPGNHPPEYNLHDDAAPSYRELTIDSYLLELERLATHGRRDVSVLLTETGYALGQNNFSFQGYPPIDEANRADYMARAFRDEWAGWAEVLGVCPYELVDPFGTWQVWDWLHPSGSRHAQYDAVRALDKAPALAAGTVTLEFRALADAVPGTYTSGAQAAASGIGSAALSGVAPVQVSAPPATATPTRTPSPAATPTPTPPLVCQPVTVNGDLEGEGGWVLPDTAYPAAITTERPRSGARSLRLGIVEEEPVYSYSTARQALTIPANASAARIRFWYYAQAEEAGHGRQYALLLDDDLAYVETLMWLSSNAREWRLWEVTLTAYAGQTVWLILGVYNDGLGGPSALFVDDVELEVCGVVAPATQTPSPSPSPTRTATASPTLTSSATATPTPLPTATGTATPTGPTPDCRELLTNGNLEGTGGWSIPDTARPARYVATPRHGGQQAVALGLLAGEANTYSYSSVEQIVALPTGAPLTLTYWSYPFSTDLTGDRQYLLLLDERGGFTTLQWSTSNAQAWQSAQVDLGAYAGQRVTLRFGVYNDGQHGTTGLVLDDVSLAACEGQPVVSPTPTRRIDLAPALPLVLKDRRAAEGALARQPGEGLAVERLLAGADGETERALALAGLTSEQEVRALALDAAGQKLAVAVGSELLVLDALSERPLFRRTFPAAISAVAAAPGFAGWHVACGVAGLLALAPDGELRAVQAEVGRVSSLAASGERLYVGDVDGRRLVVLDARTYSIMQVSPLAAAPYPLLLDQEGRRLYVGEAGSGGLLALDADTLQLLGRAQLGGLGYCHDLSLTRDGSHLYVAHALSPRYGAVSVIDGGTMTVERTRWGNQETPLWPADALTLDELRGLVYLGSAQGVAVLRSADLGGNGVFAVERSLWPRTMAQDESLSRLYLAGRGARLSWLSTRALAGAAQGD